MKNIAILTKKEFSDYFISTIAYIVISLFVVVIGVIFSKNVFVLGVANMRNTFNLIPLVLIFLIPALTMRSFAEERQNGTFELLLTSPISGVQILIAKFLANMLFLILLLIATLPIPIILNMIGNPNNGMIIAGYIGLLLLGSSYISIGQFISINNTNQITAFLITVMTIGVFYIIGLPSVLELISVNFRNIFMSISLKSHFDSVAKGVIDSRDILYYLSIWILLLYFTFQSILRIKKKGK